MFAFLLASSIEEEDCIQIYSGIKYDLTTDKCYYLETSGSYYSYFFVGKDPLDITNRSSGEKYENVYGFTPPKGDGSHEYTITSKTEQSGYFYMKDIRQSSSTKSYLVLAKNFAGKLTTFYQIRGEAYSGNMTLVYFYNPYTTTVSVANDDNTFTKFRGQKRVDDREDEETVEKFEAENEKEGYMYCDYRDEKDLYSNGKKYYQANFKIAGNNADDEYLPEKVFEIQYGKYYKNSDSIEDMTELSGYLVSGAVAGIVVACFVVVLIVLCVLYWFLFRSLFEINAKNIVLLVTAILALVNVIGFIVISVQLNKYIPPYTSRFSGYPKRFVNTQKANIAVPVIFIVVGAVAWFLGMRFSGILQYIFIGVVIAMCIMEAVTNSVFNSVANKEYYDNARNVFEGLAEDELSESELEEVQKFMEDLEEIDQIEEADFWATITDKSSAFLVTAYIVLALSLVYWFALNESNAKEENNEAKNDEEAEQQKADNDEV